MGRVCERIWRSVINIGRHLTIRLMPLGVLLFVYAAITLVMTAPAYSQLGSGIVGCCDAPQGAWGNWWTRHAILDLRTWPLSSDYKFHPQELGASSLLTIVSYNSLLSIPMQLVLGLETATNLMVLLSFVLSGVTAYLLIRSEVGHPAAAFVGSLMFAFSPALFARLTYGHYATLAIWPTPLIALSWLVALQHRNDRAAVVSGSLLGLQASINPYQGTYALVLMAMLGLGTLIDRLINRKASCRPLSMLLTSSFSIGRAAVLAGAAGTVIFSPHLIGHALDVKNSVVAPLQTPLSAAAAFAPDFLGYFVASPLHPHLAQVFAPINRQIGAFDYVRVVFPGYLALLLGTIGALQRYRTTPNYGNTSHVTDLPTIPLSSDHSTAAPVPPQHADGDSSRCSCQRSPYCRSQVRISGSPSPATGDNEASASPHRERCLSRTDDQGVPDAVAAVSIAKAETHSTVEKTSRSTGDRVPFGRENSNVGSWKLALVTLFVLSLGPLLRVGGRNTFEVGDIGFSFPLPFILFSQIPIIGQGRVPGNATFTISLCLAVLGALALSNLFRRIGYRSVSWLIALALGVGVIYEGLATPIAFTSAQASPFYKQIANEPGDYALLNVPLGWRDGRMGLGESHTVYLYYATIHQKPLVDGYANRVPDDYFEYYRSKPELGFLIDPGQLPPPQALDAELVRQTLRDLNLRYLVLHEHHHRERVADYLSSVVELGQAYRDNHIWVYRLDPD